MSTPTPCAEDSRLTKKRCKIAKALLKQRDKKKRRKTAIIYFSALILCFLMHNYFSDLTTPLKVLPETFLAMIMGYIITVIISLWNFRVVSEFINWEKVTSASQTENENQA
jgi:uncharacterized membrane protein